MDRQRQYSRGTEPKKTQNPGKPQISRQERLMAAKAAFGSPAGSDRENSFFPPGRRTGDFTGEENSLPAGGMALRFGLIRFMASWMLLLVLLAAFATGFSYHGFDRNYVQERMNDETYWNRLEREVQKIYIAAKERYGENSAK